ncbi:MAG: methyltransferase [Opitutaceae bacterium]|nr:methyltransferase [Opitutaceae bacterium]
MTSREKVQRALAHQAGPVPVDFGSTGLTGLHVSCVAGLRQHYGLPQHPVKVWEPYQMLGEVEDDLTRAMGSDCIQAYGRGTMFGFPLEGWREWRAPWGQVVQVPAGFRTHTESNGDITIFPEGDTSAPASGHMPATSYFFDTIIRQDPIDEDHLNPADNCEEFKLLGEADIAHWHREIARVQGDDRAIVSGVGGTGYGDIALVPAAFLKHPKGIRDITEWYMAVVDKQDYIHAIFEHQTQIALQNLATYAAVAGDTVDVLMICGTDFGTQSSQFCSVETFNALYAPYYRRINDWIHTHTKWKTFKHCCGAIRPLIDSFIAAGFDILNPVQCSATGMEPAGLKRDFGDRIVFWGGGVDTQKVLPFGTPAEVRAQVLERLRIFSVNGGFVFNTIHNTQARTPVANIVAMVETVHEFNRAGG